MSRLALFAAAMLAAGAAHAQRVDIAAEPNSFARPYPAHAGQLIASEVSAIDLASGVERSAEYLVFTGRAGEVVTAQVRSDVPSLQVLIRSWRSHTGKALVEGPARDAPLRLVLPKDDTYVIVVHTQGPQRFGKYLLALGGADGVPAFEAPKPRPVQVAEAPAAPRPAAPKPAAPAALPPLPVIPGVTNLRLGQPLARPAGKPGAGVEVFAFIGEAGSVLQAQAAGAGRYGATLYTPEGAEMLSATGEGAARLDAVLPRDGIYLLSVARQDGAKPYKLSIDAESPDIFQWKFRELGGYELLDDKGAVTYWTCWVMPGSVLRYTLANGQVQTLTLRAGGSGRWDYVYEGRPGGYSFTTRIEGDRFVRTSEVNTVQTFPFRDPSVRVGAYRGYLCR